VVQRGTSATTEVAAEVLAVAGAFRASPDPRTKRNAPRRWREKFSRPAGANPSVGGQLPVVALADSLHHRGGGQGAGGGRCLSGEQA